MKQKITVTLIKSTIGRLRRHRNCVRGLGLEELIILFKLMIHLKIEV